MSRSVKKGPFTDDHLLDKVTVTIADVREVEGRETGFPYSAGVGAQPDNYWQSYQQMYRRWWGY